jgi:hypothetical protein
LARVNESLTCFFYFCKKIVGNVERDWVFGRLFIRYWPLMKRYPRLFNLTLSHNVCVVASVIEEGWGKIRLRRRLWGQTVEISCTLRVRVVGLIMPMIRLGG